MTESTVTIDTLYYEELVMLQEIMLFVKDNMIFSSEDDDVFETLFEKIMTA